MKLVLFLSLIFSTSLYASQKNCLKNETHYTLAVNADGTYNPNDKMGDIYLSLKGNDQYLVLETKGNNYLWPNEGGVHILLQKNGHKFFNIKEKIVVEPFCKTNEILIKFTENDNGFFLGRID